MDWPVIDPGEMVHRITILEQTQTFDASGAAVKWLPKFENVWAAIEIVSGREVIRSGQDTTQIFATIKIWWQMGIVPTMRIQVQDDTYIIQSIDNPKKMNVILLLNCVGLSQND